MGYAPKSLTGLDFKRKTSKFVSFLTKIWKTNLSLFTGQFDYGIVFAAEMAEAKLVQVVKHCDYFYYIYG